MDLPEISASKLPTTGLSGPSGLRTFNLIKFVKNPLPWHLKPSHTTHFESALKPNDSRMVIGYSREVIENLTLDEEKYWARPEAGLLKFAPASKALIATRSLSTSNGEEWKARHKHVNASFRSKHSRDGFKDPIAKNAEKVCEWIAQNLGKPIPMFELGKKITLLNLRTVLFGLSGEETAFEKQMEKGVDILLSSALNPLSNYWPWKKKVHEGINGIYDWAYAIAKQKLDAPDASVASLMVNRESLTQEDLEKALGDMTALYVTGRDGPAAGIAWMLFLMAAMPSYQVQAEECLPAFMNEALRVLPPSFVLNPRVCTTDFKLGGATIRRGSMGFGSILARHREPNVWQNPRKFDLSRWTKPVNRFDFIPFGIGPRRCVGDQYATILTEMTLRTILREFTVSLCEDTTYDAEANAVLLQPTKSCMIKFLPKQTVSLQGPVKGNINEFVEIE